MRPKDSAPRACCKRGIATEGGAPPGTPPFTPPPLAELAKLFPQLEILEPLGQGGMGAVYKARQPALDRFVALKILAPRSGGDLDFAGRFSREARALAKLNHPNIVAVYDFGQVASSTPSTPDTRPLHYFIMEYVDGPNLRQVERAGKLTPREALEIIPQICTALQFAHDEGIVHRDIKPENVLLDKKGRVKIADFGLAKILGQETDFRLTGARDVMGTPHYMAPEQVEKPQEVDHRADIYSLGVVFYEMLTGELPLGKFDPPSHKVQIDVRLDDVVLRSLANNPDRRYQRVSDVQTEIKNITEHPAPVAPSYTPAWANRGLDYRSKATLFGLPLLHITTGIDPLTRKVRVSKGIIAIGGRAQGVIAVGGLAMGGLAIGGGAVGVIAMGGAALGVFSFAGLAIALVMALGGGAIAPIAVGGGVIGYMGFGGGGVGAHMIVANNHDPIAQHFFASWASTLLANVQLINALMVIVALCLGVVLPLWLQTRGHLTNGSRAPTGTTAPATSWRAWLWSIVFAPLLAIVLVSFVIYVIKPSTQPAASQSAPVPVQKKPAASVETWSPTLYEKPDLTKISQDAKDLMNKGQYEEALGRHIWLYNHTQEYGDAYQNSIRTTSAITDWVELGRRYPKAKKALLEIRDHAVNEFTQGRGYTDLFNEIASLNHELQEEDATYELFKAIRKGDPILARQLYYFVEALLVSRGEYQWCFETMGDPQSRFESIKRSFDMELDMQKRSAEMQERSRKQMEEWDRKAGRTNTTRYMPDTSMDMGRSATNRFVGSIGQLTEILAGSGHTNEAQNICNEALTVVDDPRIKSAVADAETRIKKQQASSPKSSTVNLKVPSLIAMNGLVTNGPKASLETWSPTLQPGEQPDLMKIQQEAIDLTKSGHYEESLQRHIWYHNHSRTDPTQAGVRNSFALGDWVELGRRYPKARQALLEIRDEDMRKCSQGQGYFELFLELSSINEALGDDEATYKVFKEMTTKDKQLARRCYPSVEGLLMSHGDYELCLDYLGEPQTRFDHIRQTWEFRKKSEQQQEEFWRQMDQRASEQRKQQGTNGVNLPAPMPMRPQIPKSADDNFVSQIRSLIEILVATKSTADAEKIRDEAVSLVDDARLKSAVSDAEEKFQKRTGNNGAAKVAPLQLQPPVTILPGAMAPLPPPQSVMRPVRSLPLGQSAGLHVATNASMISPEEQAALIEMERAKRSQLAPILPPH